MNKMAPTPLAGRDFLRESDVTREALSFLLALAADR